MGPDVPFIEEMEMARDGDNTAGDQGWELAPLLPDLLSAPLQRWSP